MVAPLVTAALVINELMAANVGEVMSPAINFDSWIELYNPGKEAVDLGGMYLSDDASDLKRWRMPSTVGSVPAGGYLVVWLGSNDLKESQAPFKLDCDGGTIYLSDASGQLVVRQDYPKAMSRTAYARKQDGGSEWGWTAQATPGATNATSAFASERLAAPTVSTGSTMFANSVSFSVEIPEGATLMYTTDGSVPTAPKAGSDETSPWTEWVTNGDCEGSDVTCLVGKDGDNGGTMGTHIVDGAGYGGTRGVKVHSVAGAPQDYTTQFFVYTPDHIWNAGDRYRFHMRIRADRACHISAQSHRTPGSYIHWQMLDGGYDITTQWQEISYEGTITNEQAGQQGGWWGQTTPSELQTIAFNLNESKSADNNFYIDDVSWESYSGEGQTTETSRKSLDGLFTAEQTTNYTFRLYQDGYLPSVPVTRSFIKNANHYTLPVISIVGDKKHFNDPKIGFDCDGDGTNGRTGNGQDYPRNYNMDWDRPVNFSYINAEGEMLFNQDVNISVSGGWTRSQRYRSFKLKSNKVFDGKNRFDFAFFPQKPYIRSKTILLRNGGNDFWTHNARFMDPALETIIQRSGIDLDVQSYVPIVEYVNGELRGILNMREPNNDKFAYANWGYDDDELDAFENMKMKNGTDEVINRIFELGRHINDKGAYDELTTLLDIDEFTNYMAVTMFLDNDDWPNNNIKAYRSQHDGRYRFISFDLDYAFALRNFNRHNDDPFAYFADFKDATTVNGEGNTNREIVRLLFNLLEHDGYRRKFIDTFSIVAGSVFEPTRANNIVDELLGNVEPMTQLMMQTGIRDGHDPGRAASTIKNKLRGRSQKMAGHMKNFSYLKLSGTSAQSVTLKSDAEGACLYINGLQVPYGDFQGHLFAPITLRAQAPTGYAFAGWKQGNSIISTDESLQLPEGSSVTLTATFKTISEEQLLEKGITPVRVNEVSAANDIFVNDYFSRNDWVELYNTTDDPIDVEGMYLSDNPNKPLKYRITRGQTKAETVIPAHGHLIVWCDKLEPLSQLHASFKLAAEGGDVILTAADETWSDRLTYTFLKGDQTAGRYPDGYGSVYVMNVPTIAKSNITSSYLVAIEQADETGISDLAIVTAELTAGMADGQLVVRGAEDADVDIRIVNIAGLPVGSHVLHLTNGFAELSLDKLHSGIYIITAFDRLGHQASLKLKR